MPKMKAKGIFCIEGDWGDDLRDRTTVDPILQLLEKSNELHIPYIRRDAGTVAEFEHYLRKWRLRKYGNYPILYLGFHGDPGVLYVENRRIPPVDLDWLEERLAGRCKGRIIHFGSCGTLATHGGRLNRFLRRTDALAVCGFKTAIGWMKSAAFEIILLSEFQHNALTRPGVEAVKKRVLGFAPRLARELQFRLVVAPK